MPEKKPLSPREASDRLSSAADTLAAADNPTARDWAGFFAALAQFAATMLPLILPFFQPKSE
jgi:hypothetical protein